MQEKREQKSITDREREEKVHISFYSKNIRRPRKQYSITVGFVLYFYTIVKNCASILHQAVAATQTVHKQRVVQTVKLEK